MSGLILNQRKKVFKAVRCLRPPAGRCWKCYAEGGKNPWTGFPLELLPNWKHWHHNGYARQHKRWIPDFSNEVCTMNIGPECQL
eukprot:839088-Pelagomonas_calceolata.AAC.5